MKLNWILWVAQIVLALMFLMAAAAKLTATDAALAAQYVPPPSFMRGIAVLEVLGAIGLVVPGLARIRTGLTPLAAAGLTIIMVGAVVTTLMSGAAGVAVPLGLGILAAFVAYGRGRLSPLPERSGPSPQAA